MHTYISCEDGDSGPGPCERGHVIGKLWNKKGKGDGWTEQIMDVNHTKCTNYAASDEEECSKVLFFFF